MDPEKLHTIFEHKVDADCNFTNLPHFPQNFIQQIVAPLCPVILRGRWPQAGKYWTPGACLVRMTGGHIARRWYVQLHGSACAAPAGELWLPTLLRRRLLLLTATGISRLAKSQCPQPAQAQPGGGSLASAPR